MEIEEGLGQRWRYGRDGFVLDLKRGVFSPVGFDVVHARHHAEGRIFIETHHYSSSWPNAVEVFELRHRGRLVGLAVYSEPGGAAVLKKWFPGREQTSLELGRLVLLDEVAFNAETWFLARTWELLWAQGYTSIISFSDPLPREAAGEVIFPGHVGTTYQAASAIYTGQTAKESQWLFPDGLVFPARRRTKIRAYAAGKTAKTCLGWETAVRELERRGAPPFTFEHGDAAGAIWVDEALEQLAGRRRHPGQHRYLWARRGPARRELEKRLLTLGVKPRPYPRIDAALILARARLRRAAPVQDC